VRLDNNLRRLGNSIVLRNGTSLVFNYYLISSTFALRDAGKSLLEKQQLLSGYFYHISLSSRR
jgi:hypothetical protein